MSEQNRKTEKIKKIATILDRMDMSGYDPRVHGDYYENMAEYLMAYGLILNPIKSRSDLIKVLGDANIAWLDHLDELDQSGLTDNDGRNAFIADYLLNYFDPDHDIPASRDYIVIRSESKSASLEVFGPFTLTEAQEEYRSIYDRIYNEESDKNIVEDVNISINPGEEHFSIASNNGSVYDVVIRRIMKGSV